MPHALIFDMDGVLVDSGPPHHESWRRLAARHGIEISEQSFKSYFGRPSRDIIRLIWGDDLSDEEIRRYDDEKEAIYRELITGNVPLMPGCRELLSALSDADLPLAVATSGPPENLNLVLDEGKLRRYFDAVVHGFDIEHGKPAPDCFLLAAERLGIPAADCGVVEDAPVGIEAAVAARMKVIALAGTHAADRLLEAGASRAVRHLSEITAALVMELS